MRLAKMEAIALNIGLAIFVAVIFVDRSRAPAQGKESRPVTPPTS